MTNTQPEFDPAELKPTRIASSDPLLKRLSRTNISPGLIGATYTVVFLLIRMLAAWRAGHLWTTGDVTGYLNDPALYTNLVIFAVVTYYVWMPRGIAMVFNGLRVNGVVGDPCPMPAKQDESKRAYRLFTEKMLILFGRRRWVVISLVTAISATLALILPQYRVLGQSAAWTADTLSLALTLLWVAIGIYCVSLVLVYVALCIYCLNQLFNNFEICVRPLHPDGAGGLGPLGDFTLTLSYIIVLIGVLLVLTPLTRNYVVTGTLQFRWTTEILVALGVYLIAAPTVFFAPLLEAHSVMKVAKNQKLLRIAARFETEYQNIRNMLDGDASELEGGVKVLKELQTVYDITSTFPAWPLDGTKLRRFGTSYVSPIILALAIDLISGYFNL